MKIVDKHYEPVWYLQFTKAEVRILQTCSERHYDALCQAQSKQGGKIYGLTNYPQTYFRWRDVDLTCKVLEQGGLIYHNDLPKHLACNKLFAQLCTLLREESTKKETTTK